MMIDLEERIRRAATLLDDETERINKPGRPASERALDTGSRRPWVPVAAGLLLLVGAGGIAWLSTHRPSDASTTIADTTASSTDGKGTITSDSANPSPAIEPSATLPPLADLVDAPITVMGAGPTEWYRLQPDLDVAWYGDGTPEGSKLCFRTVDGQDCQADDLYPSDIGGGPIGIPSRDGQWLIVTVDPEPTVTVAFDNGETATAPVERDSQSALGVARLDMAGDAAPVGLKLLFEPR